MAKAWRHLGLVLFVLPLLGCGGGGGSGNTPPTAQDSTLDTLVDMPFEVPLDASDPDGDALTFEILSGPSHGTLAGSGALLTYTPDAGYTGTDAFTFRANDGTAESNAAVVTITL